MVNKLTIKTSYKFRYELKCNKLWRRNQYILPFIIIIIIYFPIYTYGALLLKRDLYTLKMDTTIEHSSSLF